MTAKKKAEATSELAAAIRGASEADLPALNAEIEKLGEQITALQNEQSALKSARKMIGLKTLGRQPRDTRSKVDERLTQIHDLLSDGPRTVREISEETEIPEGSLHKLLKHEWFTRNQRGLWEIATTSPA